MSSFDERMKAEQAEKEQRTAHHVEVLSQVTRYAGLRENGWTFQVQDHDGFKQYYFVNSTNVPNGKLHISFPDYGNDKDKNTLWISGIYPRDRHGNDYTSYEKERPSIKCSASKAPAAIAADIMRRLMPDYLALLDKVQQRIVSYHSRIDAKSAIGALLASRFPTLLTLRDTTRGSDHYGQPNKGTDVRLFASDKSLREHGLRVDIQVEVNADNCSRCELTLSDLDSETVTAVLTLLLQRAADSSDTDKSAG